MNAGAGIAKKTGPMKARADHVDAVVGEVGRR